MDQETVLTQYLDARVAMALGELEQAQIARKLWPSAYTRGRVVWAEHQVAALRMARRDADSPGQIIHRWSKRSKEKRVP